MCGLEVEARKGRMSVHIHKGNGGSYGKKKISLASVYHGG